MGIRQAPPAPHRAPSSTSGRQLQDYERRVERSTFCGVLPGTDGAVRQCTRHGCIPVIIQTASTCCSNAWGRGDDRRARAPRKGGAGGDAADARVARRARARGGHPSTTRFWKRERRDRPDYSAGARTRGGSSDTPTQPPEGPRGTREENEETSPDDATRGSHPEIGPRTWARPGTAWGRSRRPGEFEMIMASLRYKLALRRSVVAS